MARRTDWVDTTVNLAIASAGQGSATLLGAFSVHETAGYTITRLLYELDFYKSAPVNDGHQQITWGIAMASQEAFAASVLSDPSAQGDHPERGWMVKRSHMVAQDASEMMPPVHVVGEVRSQRKIDGSELFIVIDNTPRDGTAFTVEVTGIVRVLILLP